MLLETAWQLDNSHKLTIVTISDQFVTRRLGQAEGSFCAKNQLDQFSCFYRTALCHALHMHWVIKNSSTRKKAVAHLNRDRLAESETNFRSISVKLPALFAKLKPVLRILRNVLRCHFTGFTGKTGIAHPSWHSHGVSGESCLHWYGSDFVDQVGNKYGAYKWGRCKASVLHVAHGWSIS